MKEVFVVSFKKHGMNHYVNDCVFMNREDAQDYVNKWNKWEVSEDGQGDVWFFTDYPLYETRVEI